MTAQLLLDDVRIIDLSQYIPGPFATRQLADLGADVEGHGCERDDRK